MAQLSETVAACPIPTREDITRLQVAMSALQQVEVPTKHHFIPGVYAREMFVAAGTTIIGAVHKAEHFFLLTAGTMVLTGDGIAPRRVSAPFFAISHPGVKRAGHAETDCTVLTFHRTDETDVEKIRAELTEPDVLSLFDGHNRPKLVAA
jgi:hypothetical protein